MGAHIDGFAGILADTVVVGAGDDLAAPIADAFNAAWLASEAAIRLVKPGGRNWDVTDAVNTVAESFGCKAVEDMLSYGQKRNVIDDESKRIILNPSEGKKKSADATFEDGEVYGIDILISTGEGKVS